VITKYQITQQLRRHDLRLSASDIDVLTTIEPAREYGHDQDVVLVSLQADESIAYQCIEEVADYWEDLGAEYVYVPLAFGPIQEVSR
jgi:hypothetical protein